MYMDEHGWVLIKTFFIQALKFEFCIIFTCEEVLSFSNHMKMDKQVSHGPGNCKLGWCMGPSVLIPTLAIL